MYASSRRQSTCAVRPCGDAANADETPAPSRARRRVPEKEAEEHAEHCRAVELS
jgi:hypothetical protein